MEACKSPIFFVTLRPKLSMDMNTKRLVSISIVLLQAAAMSAVVVLGKPTPLKNTTDMGLYHPVISPQGDYLLFSTQGCRGLMYYNIASGEMRELTDADNAGTDVKISDGGKMVVFRKVEYINNRRYTSICRVNVATGEQRQLRAPSRLKYAFDFNGGRIVIANRDTLFHKRLVTDIRTPRDTSYLVSIEDFDLVLYVNNVRHVLNPLGKQSYLSPSISPDEKHIVFYAMQGGTCVCDIDGKNVHKLGHVNAPQWLGNDFVVGMQDETDINDRYSNSPLVIVHRTGEDKQVYSVPNHPIVLFPAASRKGDKIVFEADGTIYVMEISIE